MKVTSSSGDNLATDLFHSRIKHASLLFEGLLNGDGHLLFFFVRIKRAWTSLTACYYTRPNVTGATCIQITLRRKDGGENEMDAVPHHIVIDKSLQ